MCLKNFTKHMGGGAKYCFTHEICINKLSKEFYQTYGGGAKYCLPPTPLSMKYDNIHERIYERYLLSADIKNEIIQLYKPKLLNI